MMGRNGSRWVNKQQWVDKWVNKQWVNKQQWVARMWDNDNAYIIETDFRFTQLITLIFDVVY